MFEIMISKVTIKTTVHCGVFLVSLYFFMEFVWKSVIINHFSLR